MRQGANARMDGRRYRRPAIEPGNGYAGAPV